MVRASSSVSPCPSSTTTSVSSSAASVSVRWSAPQGSRPAPTRPVSGWPRSRPVGWSRVPLRPRISARSPVQAVCVPRRSRKATRPGKSTVQALRARSAPVASQSPVTTKGAVVAREGPSTHSAYAVTLSRRGRPDRFAIRSRLIFTGSSVRHVLGELELDAVRAMGEAAVPLPVPAVVRPGVFSDGEQGWTPEPAGVLVAHVDGLARRVADGVVRPRRELVLAAVGGPCIAGARLRDLEAQARVRDHVDPRRGRPLALAERDQVLAAVVHEAAQPVVELPRRRGRRRLGQRHLVDGGRAARGAAAGPGARPAPPARRGCPAGSAG